MECMCMTVQPYTFLGSVHVLCKQHVPTFPR